MFTPFSVTGCSLELLNIGEQGIVACYKTQDEKILQNLIYLGITPGTTITVEQYFPFYIIKAKNKFILIDEESVHAIYVRIIDR